MTDLEGRSLDEALARAMGWTLVPGQWRQPLWNRADETVTVLPEYHASIDALLRDIEPVCRERGMLRLSIEQAGENLWNAFARIAKMRSGMSQYEHGTGPTAAIATARVFYAVLTRGER